MTTSPGQSPEARIRELLDKLKTTPAGARLQDPAFRRRHAYEALRRHPDPVLREIGDQLRDGVIQPIDILRAPAYREAFDRAARHAAKRLNPEVVIGQLERLVGDERNRQSAIDHGRRGNAGRDGGDTGDGRYGRR